MSTRLRSLLSITAGAGFLLNRHLPYGHLEFYSSSKLQGYRIYPSSRGGKRRSPVSDCLIVDRKVSLDDCIRSCGVEQVTRERPRKPGSDEPALEPEVEIRARLIFPRSAFLEQDCLPDNLVKERIVQVCVVERDQSGPRIELERRREIITERHRCKHAGPESVHHVTRKPDLRLERREVREVAFEIDRFIGANGGAGRETRTCRPKPGESGYVPAQPS